MGKTYKDYNDEDFEENEKYRVIRFKKPKWVRNIEKKRIDEDDRIDDN